MRYHADDAELEAYYAEIDKVHLQPLWEMTGLLTSAPKVKAVPYRWTATELQHCAARAGDLVPIDRGGDRRVLAMSNPGLNGAPYVSNTMWAAVQYLQPGEVAPAHRHTPSALRFVLEGDGVYTLLDGDPVAMARGDLVLTPSWVFHEHHNPSPDPMMWLDVLDLPLVATLDAVFFELPESSEPNDTTLPRSATERRFGQGAGLVPAGANAAQNQSPHSPLMVFRWSETDAALDALLEVTDGHDATIRFQDPTRGLDVMPTLRCEMRRIAGSFSTPGDRQTGTRVCAVLDGEGRVVLDGRTFSLTPGDVFVVPSWCHHRLGAESTLNIFTTSDAPVLERLGLFRTEEVS
jgi:gentisate 1,2-dioxygenase